MPLSSDRLKVRSNQIGCMIQLIVNFVFVFVLFFTGQLDFDLTNMANILDILSLKYAAPFRKRIMCTIGGLGRHIGRPSTDISVDYRSTIER